MGDVEDFIEMYRLDNGIVIPRVDILLSIPGRQGGLPPILETWKQKVFSRPLTGWTYLIREYLALSSFYDGNNSMESAPQ